jgi:hypothetical protein
MDIKAIAATITEAKNRAAGHVLPVLPPFPLAAFQSIAQVDSRDFQIEAIEQEAEDATKYTLFGTPMCFPLSVKLQTETQWWLLPMEPIITMNGGNILARRNVAKSKLRGSIKERWATDDYQITIEGLFTRYDEWKYPKDDVGKLRKILEAREPVDVMSPLFEIFGIGRIVIDSYDWPFTKGPENQAYRISALSDDEWHLLIKK